MEKHICAGTNNDWRRSLVLLRRPEIGEEVNVILVKPIKRGFYFLADGDCRFTKGHYRCGHPGTNDDLPVCCYDSTKLYDPFELDLSELKDYRLYARVEGELARYTEDDVVRYVERRRIGQEEEWVSGV